MNLESLAIGSERLSKDLREAATTITTGQARYLVDYYYQMQDARIRSGNQGRQEEGPSGWVDYVHSQQAMLEGHIRTALGIYSNNSKLGQWARSITGIGPVIAAGLLAHIDITRTPNAGALWRYAGYDPTLVWLGKEKSKQLVDELVEKSAVTDEELVLVAEGANRNPLLLRNLAMAPKPNGKVPKKLTKDLLKAALARRPWNAQLKVLCWKLGESFVKVQNNENDYYGKQYVERREKEELRNAAGENEAHAKAKAKQVGKTTEAYKFYSDGKLPPAHVYARAKRWTVKLFLSHYHHVGYEVEHGEPPARPWVIVQGGHSEFIPPPNW
jgi:hypothetical protein